MAIRPRLIAALLGAAPVLFGSFCAGAWGASPRPGWAISSLAQPSIFSAAHNAECEAGYQPPVGERFHICDSYTLIATNVGGASTSGTVEVTDALPAGLHVVEVNGTELAPNVDAPSPMTCTKTPVRCVYEGEVATAGNLVMAVELAPEGATRNVTNSATIAGGGGAPVTTSESTTEPNQVEGLTPESPNPFGLTSLGFEPTDEQGALDALAGGHPYELTAGFQFTSMLNPEALGGEHATAPTFPYHPTRNVRDVVVDLPPGFIGNPQATPQCPLSALVKSSAGESGCPPDSRIGVVLFEVGGEHALTGSSGTAAGSGSLTSALYNLAPEAGYPAEFGFFYATKPVIMHASLIRRGGQYALRVAAPGVPVAVHIGGFQLSFFGEPEVRDSGSGRQAAFLENPSNCAGGPLKAHAEIDSWEEPGAWAQAEDTVYPQVTGCERLQFGPSLQVQPETTQADEPAGYAINIKVPQAPEVAHVPATPPLRNATVMLPAGVSVSPSAADGLEGCEASGPRGFAMAQGMEHAHEAGEGEAIGPDGLSHLTAGHCPPGSMLGSVEVLTPLLSAPLRGHLYLAQPRCGGAGQPECSEASATNGDLYRVYLEAEGAGVVLKLTGTVAANPATGQLTATFRENPQLPFSELKVRLDGGPRAPLANPQACGVATTTSDLMPWSAPTTPDAMPSSSFSVVGCTSPMAFTPAFTAGTVASAAAGSSPFTMTLSRSDRQQDLAGVSVVTPPGLVGMLSQVALCQEPQASSGACPEASRIGTTTAAAGAGSHPFWISGRVYLTGPYNGAPFGLTIVVPAKAGPFNLGNVVVRAAINVDPTTAALTVTSAPLPQIRDGVPFRLQTINVTIDRPGFMIDPTNCSGQAITAAVAAAQGAVAHVSSPFAVSGCASLPFKPKLTVTTQAKTSKLNGASLDVKVSYPAGTEANIRSVKVDLPKDLPSRLETLQRACPAAVFAANPAGCPPHSVVGIAKAQTPVLPVPLTGPAYLVSHAGESFPNLVVVLQGDGVRVDLTGQTFIAHGVTSSDFATVPDVPVSSFELYLPTGRYSLLTAFGSLCKSRQRMPTKITGQNGAVIKPTTTIAVNGCPKSKSKARKAKKARRAHRAGTGRAAKGRET